MRFFTLLPLLLLGGCAADDSVDTYAPSTPGRVTRDEWGHRPGPVGFSTVILDAGHGGKDSGAVSAHTGQREKDLTLDMAHRVQAALSGSVRCELMRDSDVFVDLDDRVDRVNQHEDAVLVSLHFNSGSGRLAGPEVFYWRVDSYTLAKRIYTSLASTVPYHSGNRGLVRRRLRLTRNPDLPCVLVECGYLSHASEAASISSPAYRDQLARAIARAILDQRAQGDGSLGPLPRPLNEPPSRPTDRKE
jgi:N-acetylmuramoyl-L-alanine amidase